MKLWLVLRVGLSSCCYECDGGGEADFWFVAAPSRKVAVALVYEKIRLPGQTVKGKDCDWSYRTIEKEQFRSLPLRPWKGRMVRFVNEHEVEVKDWRNHARRTDAQ